MLALDLCLTIACSHPGPKDDEYLPIIKGKGIPYIHHFSPRFLNGHIVLNCIENPFERQAINT